MTTKHTPHPCEKSNEPCEWELLYARASSQRAVLVGALLKLEAADKLCGKWSIRESTKRKAIAACLAALAKLGD